MAEEIQSMLKIGAADPPSLVGSICQLQPDAGARRRGASTKSCVWVVCIGQRRVRAKLELSRSRRGSGALLAPRHGLPSYKLVRPFPTAAVRSHEPPSLTGQLEVIHGTQIQQSSWA